MIWLKFCICKQFKVSNNKQALSKLDETNAHMPNPALCTPVPVRLVLVWKQVKPSIPWPPPPLDIQSDCGYNGLNKKLNQWTCWDVCLTYIPHRKDPPQTFNLVRNNKVKWNWTKYHSFEKTLSRNFCHHGRNWPIIKKYSHFWVIAACW